MQSRNFVVRIVVAGVVIAASWLGMRERHQTTAAATSPFDRVVFVCCGEHGHYSAGVYLHGVPGGGPACLHLAADAARSMRQREIGDSAAGLCGFLFTQLGSEATTGGALSLWDPPRPDGQQPVDWQRYCGWNVDLVLINVDRLSAECLVGAPDPKSSEKSVVAQLDHLDFGG
jgi:hypothetical protein